MSKTRPKRPRDPAQLAKLIVDLAVESVDKAVMAPAHTNSATSQAIRGQAGGLKGGPARAQSLTEEQRQEIAKKAADERWKKRSMDR